MQFLHNELHERKVTTAIMLVLAYRPAHRLNQSARNIGNGSLSNYEKKKGKAPPYKAQIVHTLPNANFEANRLVVRTVRNALFRSWSVRSLYFITSRLKS